MSATYKFFFRCRYDNGTGEFTVPSRGAGLYFFFVHLLCDNEEEVTVSIRQNGVILCRAYAGVRDESAENETHTGSCGAVVTLEIGTTSNNHELIKHKCQPTSKNMRKSKTTHR